MQSKKPKCPDGTRRNRKTGDCQPINKENKTLLIEKIELPPKSLVEDAIVEPPKSLVEDTIVEPSKSLVEDTGLLLPEQPKKKNCPTGQRRNRKTGICETIKTQEKMEFLPVEINVDSNQTSSNTPLIEMVRYTQNQEIVRNEDGDKDKDGKQLTD